MWEVRLVRMNSAGVILHAAAVSSSGINVDLYRGESGAFSKKKAEDFAQLWRKYGWTATVVPANS